MQNIALNPQHYGGLSYLGGSCVQYNARSVGANVHFNTLVTWRDRVRCCMLPNLGHEARLRRWNPGTQQF